MELNEIYEKLCYYDERNPDSVALELEVHERKPPRENCFCDNCFYGRDRLALEILRLQDALQTIQ